MLKKMTKISLLTATLLGITAFPSTVFSASGFSVVPIDEMRIPESMKKKILSNIAQRANPTIVPDEKFPSLNRAAEAIEKQEKSKPTSLENIVNTGKLRNQPSSIADTTLAHAALFYAHTAGVYNNGQWDGLGRGYKTSDMGIVMLDEYDLTSGETTFTQEAINASVNGRPAMLTTEQSTSGENYIRLAWVTERKLYHLKSNARDLEQGKAALLAVAQGIKD